MHKFLSLLAVFNLISACEPATGPVANPSEPLAADNGRSDDEAVSASAQQLKATKDEAGAIKLNEIPSPFRGVWFGINSVCEDYAEMRIEVLPNSIQFYESEGAVTSITLMPEDTLRIAAEMSGEGETWESTSDWSLQEQDTILVRQDVDENGYPDPVRYHRCPS